MYTIRKLIRTNMRKAARRIDLFRGSVLHNHINAYWWDGIPNFGDLLTPELLKYYGFTPMNTPPNQAQVVVVGSVLEKVTENYSGIILGSGLMYEQNKSFPNANIVAVRGKLTKERINAPDDVILGDPGLLADRLIKRRHKKQFVVGIVPHFVDRDDLRINKISQKYPKDVVIIDVRQNPRKVLNQIDKCEYILSSSLHGMIAADSLKVPNGWIILSDKVLGEGFKFRDYASALDMEIESHIIDGSENILDLISLTHQVSIQVEQVKIGLDNVFTNLRLFLPEMMR